MNIWPKPIKLANRDAEYSLDKRPSEGEPAETLEDILDQIWKCERFARTEDRIDGMLRGVRIA